MSCHSLYPVQFCLSKRHGQLGHTCMNIDDRFGKAIPDRCKMLEPLWQLGATTQPLHKNALVHGHTLNLLMPRQHLCPLPHQARTHRMHQDCIVPKLHIGCLCLAQLCMVPAPPSSSSCSETQWRGERQSLLPFFSFFLHDAPLFNIYIGSTIALL